MSYIKSLFGECQKADCALNSVMTRARQGFVQYRVCMCLLATKFSLKID